MRIKKANAILGTLLFVGGMILLYLIADEDKGSLYGNPEAQKVKIMVVAIEFLFGYFDLAYKFKFNSFS